MKKILFALFFVFITISAFAQEFNVPKGYKFENKEDYAPYEPQVKEAIDWLLNTSLGSNAIKRQEVNAFFMAWLTGTPNVSVGIDGRVVNFLNNNQELLVPFMSGWVKYALENNYEKDHILGNKAGIEAVADFYRKNRGYLKKDGNIEKYEKLIEKGKLEEEIRKKLK